jgi:two-component system response regulator AtoC
MKAKPTGHILVVDDYENWRDFVGSVLRDDGHQVVTAATSSEAEDKLRNSSFDVVILDMRLVDDEKFNVQGMALLKTVREQKPSTGAVILTGYPDPLHEDRAQAFYGADAYLCKVPDDADFDIEAFRELIASLVKRRPNP